MFEFIKSLFSDTQFKPFTLVLTNGGRIEVAHREFVICIPVFELIWLTVPTEEKARMIAPSHVCEVLRDPARAA
jgi:hypothetical protein